MPKVQEPGLRRELLVMMQRDQRMRRACMFRGKPWDWSVDRDHTKRMKAIVRQYGWPTYRLVGKRAADAAWLLVQHADHDVAWQERCHRLMERAVAEHQATPALFALLTDRVLVNRGKWQLYGTQWCVKRGKVVPRRPIRDLVNLAKRRRAVGLGSMEDDRRTIAQRVKRSKRGTVPPLPISG